MPPPPAPLNADEASAATDDPTTLRSSSHPETASSRLDLVLTSEKRRGVYECDYCHSDISQLPRIRCAVCPDFDLCLDCFVTTDHKTAIARLKAAASAHDALVEDGTAALGATSGISAAAIHHDDDHGYRVCDSTRYPLFPTGRNTLAGAASSRGSSLLEEKFSEVDESKAPSEVDGSESAKAEETAATKDDAMQLEEPPQDTLPLPPTLPPILEKKTSTLTDEESAPGGGPIMEEEATRSDNFVLQDDPRAIWTIEEDLRLLEGIRVHGLGNWVDISEAVSGQGSTGKTPKRCLERYCDDFLGRYGHILPPYLLQMESATEEEDTDKTVVESTEETETLRASKRRSVLLRSPGASGGNSLVSKRRFKLVETESLPGYDQVWPLKYIPPVEGVQVGQEVLRDLAYKAEQTYLKTIAVLEKSEDVEKVRKEWAETRLMKPGGPTVLPMRPEDVATLPGADLAGFMPRRGDFDVEWENEAEQSIADMEFLPGEPQAERDLKLKVLAIYNSKLDEREKRKQFVLSRGLYDYRNNQAEDQKLPRDERDLVHRMRLFARFHTPEEHKQFIADLLKAKRLRKEIAKLQMYRRLGIRTLAEAELYELDKSRRTFHKVAQLQKEAEASKTSEASANGPTDSVSRVDETVSSSLWKQYRTTDRKMRKSINRGSNVSSPKAPPKEGQSLDKEGQRAEAMEVDPPQDKAAVVTSLNDSAVESSADRAGYNLLGPREAELCRKLELTPPQYQEIKKAIISEALSQGLLDKEGPGSSRRALVKIDVQKRGDVIDFMIQAGWISSKIGNGVKSNLLTATTVQAATAEGTN